MSNCPPIVSFQEYIACSSAVDPATRCENVDRIAEFFDRYMVLYD